jgi:hypothetical protein
MAPSGFIFPFRRHVIETIGLEGLAGWLSDF